MGLRIFGLIALQAPVVSVIRRGPSDRMRLSRWDLERAAYEPGTWLRGTIYPQRCEGRWLQIRDVANGSVSWEADASAFEPDPAPPPAEASVW
jgi:hypothetical protein